MNHKVRSKFKSLNRTTDGVPFSFLDGPAGTQVPDQVIESISNYYETSNANVHGAFITTRETDLMMSRTRSLVAQFLGAEGGHNISFGQNMTSLNFSLARAIGRYLQPGDEILITQLDHEANRGPWLSLESQGITVKEVKIKKDGTLNYKDFKEKVNEFTRLVCVGWSSNISGAVNDIRRIRKMSHKVGAWLLVDAVHYAPHFSINVQEIGIDFLLCSAYKFYGPHVGILYSKTGLLDRLPTDRLRTTYQHAPFSIETGTLNHAAIAGVKSSIEFIISFGSGHSSHEKLSQAMDVIGKHEFKLAKMLYKGLKSNRRIKIIGPKMKEGRRAPTISFLHKNLTATQVCTALAKKNIFAWSGHFYAIRAAEVLGLIERGGVTRMGISIYTNKEDISRTLEVVNSL